MRALRACLVLCVACSSVARNRAPPPDASERSVAEPANPRSASGELAALSVPGFLPAALFVPADGAPRPLVVASHGAGGDPEWECEHWRSLTQSRAFVLCPRGARIDVRVPSGHFYPTHFALEREVVAAVRAARTAYGARILEPSAIYAGFSQGAIMGAAMIAKHGREFPYLALIEGGYEYWSAGHARSFARSGGQRVLFMCGTRWCAEKSRAPADWLERAGVEVRIEHVVGAGHTPAGPVMERTRAVLPWLLAGDERWFP